LSAKGVELDKSLESDKHYWHGYSEMYEEIFSLIASPSSILEFGVFHGASIRFLNQRFPEAKILGLDILPVQTDWPVGHNISYGKINQADFQGLCEYFQVLNEFFNLVIEDGSHHPVHQVNSLVSVLPQMKPGSIYVVEDIHTSKQELGENFHFDQPTKWRSEKKPKRFLNLYNFLLGLEHSIRLGGEPLSRYVDEDWAFGRLTREQAEYISSRVKSVSFFNRNTYPSKCHNCGSSEYEIALNLCSCGVNILSSFDSISAFVILN
jgi:hypothetical protein